MSEGSEHMRLGVNIVAMYLQRGTTRDDDESNIGRKLLFFSYIVIDIAIFWMRGMERDLDRKLYRRF